MNVIAYKLLVKTKYLLFGIKDYTQVINKNNDNK